MIARRPLQRHNHPCPSWRVRRHQRLALAVLTLLVVPPGVVAQAAPRQEPAELWRQFPLDTEGSTPQAPAERELAPPSSARTGGNTGEDRQGSVVTTQVAAIVLAIAIVLMLTAARAYATRGTFELRSDGRRRHLIRPFTNVINRPRSAWRRRRQFAIRRSPHRHRFRGAAQSLALRATAVDLSASLVPEVGALKKNPHPLSLSAGNESTVSEVGTLEGRLAMFSARERSDRADESESLKAKANTHGSLAKRDDSAAQVEVETLKQKLAVRHAQSDSPPGDDLQTLKDKLDVDPAGAKPENIPHSDLETLRAKLGSHEDKLDVDLAGAKPESIPHSELETLRAKLGAHEQSLKGERRTVPIGDARSRESERETPPKVPGKMSRRASRRNTTFSSDAHAASVDALTLADQPTVKVTEPQVPPASSAKMLPDDFMQRSRLAKVLWLALWLLLIGLLLLNIAVLLGIGVAS
jgi:hypothetical protein